MFLIGPWPTYIARPGSSFNSGCYSLQAWNTHTHNWKLIPILLNELYTSVWAAFSIILQYSILFLITMVSMGKGATVSSSNLAYAPVSNYVRLLLALLLVHLVCLAKLHDTVDLTMQSLRYKKNSKAPKPANHCWNKIFSQNQSIVTWAYLYYINVTS